MYYYLLFMGWTHRRYVALLLGTVLGRSTMDATGGGVEEGRNPLRSNPSGDDDDGDERIYYPDGPGGHQHMDMHGG
jgi:hypothetical protein